MKKRTKEERIKYHQDKIDYFTEQIRRIKLMDSVFLRMKIPHYEDSIDYNKRSIEEIKSEKEEKNTKG